MDCQFVTSRKGIRVFRKRHLCARSWKKGAGGVGKETLYAHEIRNVFPGKTLHNICHSTKTKEQSGNLPYPVFLNSIPWPHCPTRCEAWWGQEPQLSWYPNVEKGLTNLNLFNNSKKFIQQKFTECLQYVRHYFGALSMNKKISLMEFIF